MTQGDLNNEPTWVGLAFEYLCNCVANVNVVPVDVLEPPELVLAEILSVTTAWWQAKHAKLTPCDRRRSFRDIAARPSSRDPRISPLDSPALQKRRTVVAGLQKSGHWQSLATAARLGWRSSWRAVCLAQAGTERQRMKAQ